MAKSEMLTSKSSMLRFHCIRWYNQVRMEEAIDSIKTGAEKEIKRPRRRKTAKSAEPVVVAELKQEVSAASRPARRPRTRKAPIVAQYASRQPAFSAPGRTKQLIIAGGVAMVVMGLSAWIGFSDTGAIDVSARIAERNAQLVSGASGGEGGQTNQIVPVQTSAPAVPNGGFRPRGDGSAVSKALPPAPEMVASSTDVAATTTEPVAESEENGTDGAESDDSNVAEEEGTTNESSPSATDSIDSGNQSL